MQNRGKDNEILRRDQRTNVDVSRKTHVYGKPKHKEKQERL